MIIVVVVTVLIFVVLLEEHTFPGCVVPARLIGVLEAKQTEKGKTIRNDRFVTVIETPYNPPMFSSLEEVSPQYLDELEHFFIAYNQMEGREFKPVGRHGPEIAWQRIKANLFDHASDSIRAGKS